MRERIIRFARTFRWGARSGVPMTLRRLFRLALVDIRAAPVGLNFAERLALWLWRVVCG